MAFLSIDETVEIHEMFKVPAQAVLDVPDSSYYVWIVPYMIAAAIVFLAYFKFLMRLPKRTRSLFFLSGGIFILGAVGFEVHGNIEHVRQAHNNPFFYLSSTIEELLEMLGVICFIYALIDYAIRKFESLTVAITSQPSYASRFQPPASPDFKTN